MVAKFSYAPLLAASYLYNICTKKKAEDLSFENLERVAFGENSNKWGNKFGW